MKTLSKIFSISHWRSLLWRLTSVFATWVFASPGLVVNYFPWIFMYQVFKGTAEDAAMNLIFAKTTLGPPLSKAITVYAFDNDLYMQLSYDGVNYSEAVEIPSGQFYHFSQTARSARVYNQTAGQDARFQFIAWYVISEY